MVHRPSLLWTCYLSLVAGISGWLKGSTKVVDAALQPIALPQKHISMDSADENSQHHAFVRNRDLSLQDDPTGFIVKFHECSREPEVAVLEVCMELHSFGGYCGFFTIQFYAWSRFVTDHMFHRMTTDLCAVCEECPENPGMRNTMGPDYDICFILIWNKGYCAEICEDRRPIVSFELNEECSREIATECYANEFSPFYPGRTKETAKFADICFPPELEQWEGEWIESCDTPSYPSYFDQDSIGSFGNSWLHCNLEDSLPCKHLLSQLRFCDQPSTGDHWRHPKLPGIEKEVLSNACPTVESSVQPSNSPSTSKSTEQPSNLPSRTPKPTEHVEEVQLPARTESVVSKDTAKHRSGAVLLCLVFLLGSVVGVVGMKLLSSLQLNQRRSDQYTQLEELHQREPLYHRVLEMNDLSLT